VRRLFVTIALVLAAGEALGATARLEVEPKTAHLGDPLKVRLTVDPGTQGSVEAASLPTEWGPAQVLSGGWEPAAAGSATRVWSGTIALYQIGVIEIPPVEVSIAGTAPSSVSTEPVTLTIEGTVPAGEKPKDLADLKAPASIPPDWRPLKVALAGVAALLVTAAVAWWLWRRYAARLAAVAAPVDPFRRLPPHVWVYEELERLLARRLAEEGRIGLFYDELTRIVKQYLEGRYRIELLERTTSEVPAALKIAGAPVEAALLARTLLDSGDLVKFARESAGPEQCRAAVEEAYRLVDLTKPASAATAVPADATAGAAR
jgi:hypothetical protein